MFLPNSSPLDVTDQNSFLPLRALPELLARDIFSAMPAEASRANASAIFNGIRFC